MNKQNAQHFLPLLILVVLVTSFLWVVLDPLSEPTETRLSEDTEIRVITQEDIAIGSDELQEWETYKSDALGFTIRYPADEVIIDGVAEDGSVYFTLAKYENHGMYPPTGLQILRRGDEGGVVEEAVMSDIVPSRQADALSKYRYYQINNAYGIGRPGQDEYILTDELNTGYPVRMFAYSTDEDDEAIFVEMIKTFRFER